MKKFALILAVAFTMGLASTNVSAVGKEKVKKAAKTECCAKTTECSKDKKACCAAAKTSETPAKPEKPAK